jgi:hypothetical protein
LGHPTDITDEKEGSGMGSSYFIESNKKRIIQICTRKVISLLYDTWGYEYNNAVKVNKNEEVPYEGDCKKNGYDG